MTASIGHNGGPTFDDIVRDNKDRGVLISIREVIIEAVRDPRLERRHLRVLAEVFACINDETGVAYPGRSTIAARTRKWNPSDGGEEDFGYTDAGVSKTLSELVDYGYLVSTKRAVERGGKALTLYAIRKPSTEELQDQITAWIMAQRLAAPRRNWRNTKAESTHVGKLSGPDSTHVGKPTHVGGVSDPKSTHAGGVSTPESMHVGKLWGAESTHVGNSTHVHIERAESTSDSTHVHPTVTSRKESVRTDVDADAPAKASSYPQANGGEDHIGHGVYVNGETVRHAAFAISLPGIRMQALNSGLTATELKDRCLAHALQWAVEIENGQRPDKVLPSKIANFLARSIMGEVNQMKIQAVREAKASTPSSIGRLPALDGEVAKNETRAERLARVAGEIARSEGGSK